MRALLLVSLVFSWFSNAWGGEVVHPGSVYVFNLETIKKFESKPSDSKTFKARAEIDAYELEYLVESRRNKVAIEFPYDYYRARLLPMTIGLFQLNGAFQTEIKRVIREANDELDTAKGLNRLVKIDYELLKGPRQNILDLDKTKQEFYSSRINDIKEDIDRASKPGLFPLFMNGELICNGNEGDTLQGKIKRADFSILLGRAFFDLSKKSVEELNVLDWSSFAKRFLENSNTDEKNRLNSVRGYSSNLINSLKNFYQCELNPYKNQEVLERKAAFLERIFKMKYGLEFLERIGWTKMKRDLQSNFGNVSISALPGKILVNYHNSLRKDALIKYYKELKGEDIVKILSEQETFVFIDNAERKNKPAFDNKSPNISNISSEVLRQ